MKIIRITTDNEISVHEFPEGTYTKQNEVLGNLIGPKCELIEHVMPQRLYNVIGASNTVGREPGSCANILIDEDGHYHRLPVNVVGSWMYETDKHGYPILGIFWSQERHGLELGLISADFQKSSLISYIPN